MRCWTSVSLFMNVDFGLFGSYVGGVFYDVFCFETVLCLVFLLVVHDR